jgi:hypothetical protein
MENNIIKYDFNLRTYYKKKLRYLLIQKYNLEIFSKRNISLINKLIKIELYIDCITMSDEDVILANSLILLENITGQKGIGVGKYRYVGNSKKFFYTAKLLIRNSIMFNFLNYFVLCCLPLYYKRNGIIKDKIKKDEYFINIVDLNIFPNFKMIVINNNIKIKFIGNKLGIDYILEDLFSIIKIKEYN